MSNLHLARIYRRSTQTFLIHIPTVHPPLFTCIVTDYSVPTNDYAKLPLTTFCLNITVASSLVAQNIMDAIYVNNYNLDNMTVGPSIGPTVIL